jgi:hypothetical protein
MTALDTTLDRVPVQRITTEAREVEFRRTALTVLAGLFWLVGWLAAKTLGGIWLALAWSATAVRVGWSDARPQRPAAPRS